MEICPLSPMVEEDFAGIFFDSFRAIHPNDCGSETIPPINLIAKDIRSIPIIP